MKHSIPPKHAMRETGLCRYNVLSLEYTKNSPHSASGKRQFYVQFSAINDGKSLTNGPQGRQKRTQNKKEMKAAVAITRPCQPQEERH